MSAVATCCTWCERATFELPHGVAMVLVGIIERASCLEWSVYACGLCVQRHRIIPASEQPDGWPGEVGYRTRAA